MAQRGVNKVLLIGNLGADPETRYMPNGDAVTTLRIATGETWKDKNTGEQKEAVEWHSVVIYRKLAEIAGEYLRKGSKVFIEGRLRTRKWQDKDGNDRYTTQIIADQMQMLDRNPNASESRQGGGASSSQNSRNQAPSHAGPGNDPPTDYDFDDDIPF